LKINRLCGSLVWFSALRSFLRVYSLRSVWSGYTCDRALRDVSPSQPMVSPEVCTDTFPLRTLGVNKSGGGSKKYRVRFSSPRVRSPSVNFLFNATG